MVMCRLVVLLAVGTLAGCAQTETSVDELGPWAPRGGAPQLNEAPFRVDVDPGVVGTFVAASVVPEERNIEDGLAIFASGLGDGGSARLVDPATGETLGSSGDPTGWGDDGRTFHYFIIPGTNLDAEFAVPLDLMVDLPEQVPQVNLMVCHRTVWDTADTVTPGTLRYAVQQAQNDDSICFHPGVFASYPGDVALGSQITVDKRVSIHGTSPSAVVVTTNAMDRIFTVTAPAHLDFMRLLAGNSDQGGLVRAGRVTIRDSELYFGSAQQGGNIYSEQSLVLQDTLIYGGTAEDGGGIYANGSATLSNVDIQESDASQHGGGIYLDGSGLIHLDAVTNVEANTAERGGGIYLDGPTLQFGGEVHLNHASGSGTPGGGIFTASGGLLTTGTANVHDNTPDDFGS